MDEKSFPQMPDGEGINTLQITVMFCAVEALIATHPNKSEVKKIFDQLIGQIQAGLGVQGENPAALGWLRLISAKLFSEPSDIQ